MSKVYEAHLEDMERQSALKDIHDHRDDQITLLIGRLKAANAEIDRLEEENAKLRDTVDIYNAHYDNGRV